MAERPKPGIQAPRFLPAACAALAVLIVSLESPRALLFLATDGVVAAAILASAALAGLWLVPLFRLGDLPLRWHLLLGAGLGIGTLALLVLGFGLVGWLNRALWMGLLIGGGGAGLFRLVRVVRARPQPAAAAHDPLRWLWLVACPFAALTLLVAVIPPGLLWAEEGNGYDVLEYHLEMPREYFDAGRITYAPHNVYANFPANAEMLYLLAMIVRGGPLEGLLAAQLINAFLAFGVAAAAWLAGREVSPTAGVVAGLLAATTGWLTYLSGVAYVENAMLFFAMLSAAALIRASASGTAHPLRWVAVAGMLAGLATGCKYTAAVLVAIPLGLAVLAAAWPTQRRRLVALVVFGGLAGAAFAPWLLKNLAFTGNPVFPLAGRIFPASPVGWSPERAEHFARSHAPGPDESSLGARVRMLASKVVADPHQRFGPALFVLAIAALIANRRRRHTWVWGVVLLAQVALWLGFTHLYARFAVVLLVPLVILAGHGFDESRHMLGRAGLALLLAGAIWDLNFMTGVYRLHLYTPSGRIGIEGNPDVFTAGLAPGGELLGYVNRTLPESSRILLVGEARAFYFLRPVDYCTVFNLNPFVEAVETARTPSDLQAWLGRHGYTHVYVSWSEIARLRRSRYGFAESITPDLFEHLVSSGVLRRVQAYGSASQPYAELYEVERP